MCPWHMVKTAVEVDFRRNTVGDGVRDEERTMSHRPASPMWASVTTPPRIVTKQMVSPDDPVLIWRLSWFSPFLNEVSTSTPRRLSLLATERESFPSTRWPSKCPVTVGPRYQGRGSESLPGILLPCSWPLDGNDAVDRRPH